MRECPQPEWDESPSDGRHKYDKDGYCIYCGNKRIDFTEIVKESDRRVRDFFERRKGEKP